MRKVWIEAALNGGWGRAMQPGIPVTVEEIVAEGVACARAGATIIHIHAYDGGGQQTYDWQVYARIVEGIRKQIDVPIYPSYPALTTTGSGNSTVANATAFASPISKRSPRAASGRLRHHRPRQRQFQPDQSHVERRTGQHLHEP